LLLKRDGSRWTMEEGFFAGKMSTGEVLFVHFPNKQGQTR